jgi:hypothetical protein
MMTFIRKSLVSNSYPQPPAFIEAGAQIN